jgi:hypothetical protein
VQHQARADRPQIEVMEMFTILIVVAVEAVLLMLFGVVRMVLNERHQQRIQHERAAAFFAHQDQRRRWVESAARESLMTKVDQRAP